MSARRTTCSPPRGSAPFPSRGSRWPRCTESHARRHRVHRRLAVAGSLAGVLIIVAGGLMLSRPGDGRRATPGTSSPSSGAPPELGAVLHELPVPPGSVARPVAEASQAMIEVGRTPQDSAADRVLDLTAVTVADGLVVDDPPQPDVDRRVQLASGGGRCRPVHVARERRRVRAQPDDLRPCRRQRGGHPGQRLGGAPASEDRSADVVGGPVGHGVLDCRHQHHAVRHVHADRG